MALDRQYILTEDGGKIMLESGLGALIMESIKTQVDVTGLTVRLLTGRLRVERWTEISTPSGQWTEIDTGV